MSPPASEQPVPPPPPPPPPPEAPLSVMPPPPPPLPPAPRSVPMPDVSKLVSVNSAMAAATRVAQMGLPQDAMWVVDLRGAASVAFGTTLSQRAAMPTAVVPTFNNWPADNEVIPAEETLAAMVSMSPRRPQPEDIYARPVFLLDAWRLAFRNEEVDDQMFDNRYYLNQADLPDIERLRTQGIRRVIYVVESLETVTTEEDDLHALFTAYQEAGIEIDMVDLALLAGYSQGGTWADALPLHVLLVVPRVTVFDNPGFFLRARGGFGGMYAHPGYSRYGVGHSSFHAYTGRGG